ncbi:hypothetical protein [Myxococcus sp. CA040A]|uniref:hypothetical protein n=1 Tax=Myxococcus sp. CA040A TaxID=2741738 RepID=UPI00157BA0EA|nr:hypothetical protein [Myxococcus sp. CA040A]NTX07030.1 hypothetical protein [Myxococcus sp. CA040A]
MKLLTTGGLLALGLLFGCGGPVDEGIENESDAQLDEVEQGYHAPAICGKTVSCPAGLECCFSPARCLPSCGGGGEN